MLSVTRMSVFAGVLVAVVVGLLVAAASGAVALPLFLGKVGNFQIGATQIRGTGFNLALAVDQDSSESGGALPVGELSFDRAEIDGLRLEKDFDLTAVLGPGGGDDWKLAITTGRETTAAGLKLDAAGVCADGIGFGPGFEINGRGGAAQVTDSFSLGASTITLDKPGIEATFLSTNQINLAGIRIDIRREPLAFAPCAAAAARDN